MKNLCKRFNSAGKKLVAGIALVFACSTGAGVAMPAPAEAGNDLLNLGGGAIAGILGGQACANAGGTAAGVACGLAGAIAGYYATDYITDKVTGYTQNQSASLPPQYRYAPPTFNSAPHFQQVTETYNRMSGNGAAPQQFSGEAPVDFRLHQQTAFCMNVSNPASLDAENRNDCGPILNRTEKGRQFLAALRPDLLQKN